MIRLYLTVEGKTEERFVKKVLADHLSSRDVYPSARSVLTSRHKHKEFRGGFRRGKMSYETVKQDIETWLREQKHQDCRFTTMFDLYGLPDKFPGYEEAQKRNDPYKKVGILEDAFARNINDPRFIPYIQLHEFEALILVNPEQLASEYLEHDAQIRRLVKMIGSTNPELVNDGPQSSPSHRILKEIPEYHKTIAGPNIVANIGIDKLKQRCPHFSQWIVRLEDLGKDSINSLSSSVE